MEKSLKEKLARVVFEEVYKHVRPPWEDYECCIFKSENSCLLLFYKQTVFQAYTKKYLPNIVEWMLKLVINCLYFSLRY